MLIRVRDAEACEPQPNLYWDTVWVNRLDASGGWGDWVLAGPGDSAEEAGGLRSQAALHTATLIQLFSDRRLPDEMRSPRADGDPRGWWGDSIRLEDEPDFQTGSLLWTLERGVLNERVAALAVDYALEALATLIDQGAVARTTVESEIDLAIGMLALRVRHYDTDGATIYDQRFQTLWDQVARNPRMNFGT